MMRLTMLLAVALSAPVHAQTQTQQNVMTHVGRLIALTNKCQSLKPNQLIIGMVLRQHGIVMDRAPYSDFIVAKGREYAKEIASMDEQAVCDAGRKLYGKAGEKVPNLLFN